MLYSEFLKGTRAPETPDTYDQFQIIGQIYEDCEGMTKEEAYRIWKQTYGRELKRRELRQRERLELLINREDYDSADRPHRAAIYHELSTLFWAAYYNKDGSRCRLATEGRCFTDVYGITWILRYDGRYPNGNTIFTVYNTLTGKKSQSQKDVDQQIKEATQKVAADTKISLKLDQIGYDVKSIKEDINTTKKEVRELDKKVALLDASIRSAHKRMDSAGIGRADLIEHIEHEKVERNEHHGE